MNKFHVSEQEMCDDNSDIHVCIWGCRILTGTSVGSGRFRTAPERRDVGVPPLPKLLGPTHPRVCAGCVAGLVTGARALISGNKTSVNVLELFRIKYAVRQVTVGQLK